MKEFYPEESIVGERILIIVDMQYDFIDGSLSNTAAQEIVKPICDLIKKEYFDTIILTRDTHTKDYLSTPEGKKLPVKHCIEGTKGWLVHEDIVNAVHEAGRECHYIDKPTFGYTGWSHLSFFGARDADITVVGTCTDICVISNVLALKAEFPEANIQVIGDLCAGLTPEKHKEALDVMESCQVDIVFTKPMETAEIIDIK